jgi:hypothetical protein
MSSEKHALRDLLHEATHRVPGVPAHVEHPRGHQGRVPVRESGARQVRPVSVQDRERGSVRHSGLNHSPARQPRVLVAWQRRVAAFFGQELR